MSDSIHSKLDEFLFVEDVNVVTDIFRSVFEELRDRYGCKEVI